MFFTKASIVLLYQRIFITTQSRKTVIWWAIWFVFWWNLLYTVAVILTVTTECVGKEDKVAKGEQCIDQSAFVISATVINVVSDLMILIIPIVAIWGLQMAKRPKLRLSAVFAVGLMQAFTILPLVSNEKADTGYRGVFASVARLGYLIPEAGRPNQTVIVMALLMLKCAILLPKAMQALNTADNYVAASRSKRAVSLWAAYPYYHRFTVIGPSTTLRPIRISRLRKFLLTAFSLIDEVRKHLTPVCSLVIRPHLERMKSWMKFSVNGETHCQPGRRKCEGLLLNIATHCESFRSLYRSTLAFVLESVGGRSAFLDAFGECSVLAIKKITVSEALPHHH